MPSLLSRRPFCRWTAAAVFLGGTAAGAQGAGNVIDQQNRVATGPTITIENTFDFVRQTFTPTRDQISGFGLSLAGPVATTTRFNVLVGLANGSEEPLLSAAFTISPRASYAGFDTTFAVPAQLRVGELYVLVLGLQTGAVTFLTGAGDPYPGGSVYVNGEELPGQDLVFRTYAPAATTVPEPATVVLVGAGLMAVAAGVRRRRAG